MNTVEKTNPLDLLNTLFNYGEQSHLINGFNVRIEHDSDAENPFSQWGTGEPQLIASYGRTIENYGLCNDGYSFDYLPDLTREQIRANLDDLKLIFGYDFLLRGLNRVTSDNYGHWTSNSHYRDGVELINDALNIVYDRLNNSDKMDLYSEILAMQGIVSLTTTSRGSSQGEWADLLIIATPEYLKTTGAKVTEPSDLQSSANLFGAWAWGNTYGYVIENPVTCSSCGHAEPEIVDSCWGFYGDHKDSGILETIAEHLT